MAQIVSSRIRVALLACLAAAALPLMLLCLAQGQQVHRNSFENPTPVWARGPADAPFKETAHEVTDQTAHTGQLSEHLQLTAEVGTYLHYSYSTGRAPLGEELNASLWLKANRPGAQLMARLVLPRERNPNNLNEPLTTLLRGKQYQLAGRWQRLDLSHPVKLAKEQQQLMRAEFKRDVDFTDAYIDQLVLNVYSGPGLTEVWIDDLEIGPVLDGDPTPRRPLNAGGETPATPTANPRPAASPTAHTTVELNRFLTVNGKRFFMRGIRYSGTPLKTLRDADFNVLYFDSPPAPALLEEAISQRFWMVPLLPLPAGNSQTVSLDGTSGNLAPYLRDDAVLFWDLGDGRVLEEAALVGRVAQAVKAADPGQRPVGADVWDGFRAYSRDPEFVLGAHRWPLMTALELPRYRDWLNQRRLLANPGTFMWTWIQTHLPDWYTSLVHARPSDSAENNGFSEPIGPQPEQVRLLTYLALSAGCQGLGFWSDRYLADSHQGQDRLLTLALLNQELRMLEPMLLTAIDPPAWIETSSGDVKAAVLRTERGVLVMPIWVGHGAQFVPGQSAASQLSVVVPQVPNGTQAWEISPAEVRSLHTERVAGGTKVTVPEFGLTTAIIFTADIASPPNTPPALLVRLQEQVHATRKLAAQWVHDLAQVEIEKVLKVEAELERAGHVLPDGQALKDAVQARLRSCVEHWRNGDYREAYAEGQRALRPLRILMRAQWAEAVKELDTPVASAYAVSFYTLPKHWELMTQVRRSTAGANALPDGDFEAAQDQQHTPWQPTEVTLPQDNVELSAWRATDDPREGKHCLKLEIKPKNPELPPAALERTYLGINSPTVKLEPGTLVRISGWVRVPKEITASADGALMYDSAGGEPLAVRQGGPTPWKKFTLYRWDPLESTCRHASLSIL